jgi:RNA polymerase sigma-70 factor (ECF subfamily)
MSAKSENPREQELLAAARAGDESAFGSLIEPHRAELQAHAYRMLGSLHDAEDAMQETMLRAWRGIARFEGRSSLRSWLYTITTNSSLRLIERRPKRVLPIEYGPPADPHAEVGKPLVESVWIEPYPDERLPTDDESASPEARYEQRESVELAFTAALQHLPPRQRAALIMTDVLGFSPAEVADALDATPASIYSALQRARKAAEDDLPEQSQQETIDELGDEHVREIVDRFMAAWESTDIEKLRALLTDDCVMAMPPWSEWFNGRDAIVDFLSRGPLQDGKRWKLVPTAASGQPALACYVDYDDGSFRPEGIIVISLSGEGRVSEFTSFRVPDLFAKFGLPATMDS